jgi:hypothetical protein
MPPDTVESAPGAGGIAGDGVHSNSVARFNVPGRDPPPRANQFAGVKPRVAKQGYIRFLTLRDLDGRSRAVSKCNELRAALETDLGGADTLTTAQSQLVQRAALIGVQLEDFETRWILGEAIEFTDYMTGVNVQRRVLTTLGLERRARDVGRSATLQEYLSARANGNDVVVGVADTSTEPVIEAGIDLAPEGARNVIGESVDALSGAPGRVPAPEPNERMGDEAHDSHRVVGGESTP